MHCRAKSLRWEVNLSLVTEHSRGLAVRGSYAGGALSDRFLGRSVWRIRRLMPAALAAYL
jgi:hypothetical protein